MKKHFNKELVMTKKTMKILRSLLNVGAVIIIVLILMFKVRDHCHITGKHRGSAHRDCNNNLKLNHKIPMVFHNLKNYDSHLIVQELGKFNLKVSVIPNGLEKYINFTTNNNF